MLIIGEAIDLREDKAYGALLYLLLNIAVILKLLLKVKYFKKLLLRKTGS